MPSKPPKSHPKPSTPSFSSNPTPSIPKALPYKYRPPPSTVRAESERQAAAQAATQAQTSGSKPPSLLRRILDPKHGGPVTTIPRAAPMPGAAAVKGKPAGSASSSADLASALRTPNKFRLAALAIATASIVAAGSIYGAGLKMRYDAWKAKRVLEDTNSPVVEAADVSPQDMVAFTRKREKEKSERIYALEGTRGRLVFSRDELRRKIAEVEARLAQARIEEGKRVGEVGGAVR